jgi:hypothetical protein
MSGGRVSVCFLSPVPFPIFYFSVEHAVIFEFFRALFKILLTFLQSQSQTFHTVALGFKIIANL